LLRIVGGAMSSLFVVCDVSRETKQLWF
jgi:hypothetical protein